MWPACLGWPPYLPTRDRSALAAVRMCGRCGRYKALHSLEMHAPAIFASTVQTHPRSNTHTACTLHERTVGPNARDPGTASVGHELGQPVAPAAV